MFITGVWCNGSTGVFEALGLGPIPNTPAMLGYSIKVSISSSELDDLGSIPSAPSMVP